MKTPLLTVLCVLVSMATTLPCLSATSDWQDLGGGKARLVADINPVTSTIEGALEVQLKQGWSTYWRYPGSAGIPPMFDFSHSSGLDAEDPEFPVPQLLGSDELRYAGYKKSVSFPFSGHFDPGTQSVIKLNLMIGVCETICIPATAEFTIPGIELWQSDPVARKVINAARLVLPQSMSTDRILESRQVAADGTLRITVKRMGHFDKPELFVEGPANWYLTPARRLSVSEETVTFALDVSRAPADADLLDTSLTYTLVEENHGLEFRD